jgi:hypothetical protein
MMFFLRELLEKAMDCKRWLFSILAGAFFFVPIHPRNLVKSTPTVELKTIGGVSIWDLSTLEANLLSAVEKFLIQKTTPTPIAPDLVTIVVQTLSPTGLIFKTKLEQAPEEKLTILKKCAQAFDDLVGDVSFFIEQFLKDEPSVELEKQQKLIFGIGQQFRAYFKKLFKITSKSFMLDFKTEFNDWSVFGYSSISNPSADPEAIVADLNRTFNLLISTDPQSYQTIEYKEWLSAYVSMVRRLSDDLKGISTQNLIFMPKFTREALVEFVYKALSLFISRNRRIIYACERYYSHFVKEITTRVGVLAYWLYNRVPCDKTLSMAKQNRFKFETAYVKTCKIFNQVPLYNPFREELS